MKAIILAAGKGSRLQPLTDHTPKPLLEVAGRPILDHIFENLPDEVDEVIVITKHLEDVLKKHISKQTAFGIYKPAVTTITQGDQSGTFGALLSVKHLIAPGERFFVMNGDDLHSKKELVQHLPFHLSSGIQKRIMPAYYSCEVDASGVIRRFRPQTEEEKVTGTYIATGVYLLDDKIFSFAPVEISGGELGLPQTLIVNTETYPLYAVITTEWQPVNNFTDLEDAKKRFA